jgi:hypothetical protein
MKSLLQVFQQKVGLSLSVVAFSALFMLNAGQASAQNYQNPATALATIDATLPVLAASTGKGNPTGFSNSTKSAQQVASATLTTAATEVGLQVTFLMAVKDNLVAGMDTGASIDAVYNGLNQQINNVATRQAQLDAVRLYTIDLLD